MNGSLQVPIAPGRKMGAWVCLAAVLLLWSPLWAAAWQANGMDCCSSGMCAAHDQAKPRSTNKNATTPAASPMDCGHESDGQTHAGMTKCSLACCHDSNPAFAAAVVFVLPEPATLSQPAPSLSPVTKSSTMESVKSCEPPTPPPRISPLAV